MFRWPRCACEVRVFGAQVGKLKASGVPEHVLVSLKAELDVQTYVTINLIVRVKKEKWFEKIYVNFNLSSDDSIDLIQNIILKKAVEHQSPK